MHNAGVALPARQRRVKAICDLARLASGVYCTIIIIDNTNLINFTVFMEIGTRAQRYTRWMTHKIQQCLNTHHHPFKSCIIYNPHAILCREQSRANRRNPR